MPSIQEVITRLLLPEVVRHTEETTTAHIYNSAVNRPHHNTTASNATHKENTMEYPEEIYQVFIDDTSGSGRRHAYNIGCARGYQSGYQSGYEAGYEAGKAEQADPLAGYSNLTEAIKSEQPIDWERLDGLKVQCVNPGLRGELQGTLERDPKCSVDRSFGWWNSDMDEAYTCALRDAWDGVKGWTLWVEGEVPLIRKTADQLELGTYFLGTTPEKKAESLVYVGGWNIRDCKSIYHAPTMLKSPLPAEKWEVLEEYGPFQKPEGK